ncbi:MAG: thiamine-binding protein [Bacteroidota bacterium]
MESTAKKANMSLQVVPVNTTDAYPIIDEAIKVVENSGVRYTVQPFSTIMEGELTRLVEVAMAAKDAALAAGGEELILNIQIHLRKDGSVSFEEKTGKYE